MNQEEYWRMFHLVRGDVEAAIGCSATYLTINRISAADYDTAQKLNRHADFWRATTYSLQSSFFIALGRFFDKTKGTYTIEDVVDCTIEYPGFFTKEELRKRKREDSQVFGDAPDPEWMAEYLASVCEPSRKDLELLRTELKPHIETFRKIYEPIRHQYFAHRAKSSSEAITALFSAATVADLAEVLKFIYGLIWGITEMAHNGALPGQWSEKHYDGLFRVYQESTEELIKRL